MVGLRNVEDLMPSALSGECGSASASPPSRWTRDHSLRRADDGARPDHGRRHQRSDHQAQGGDPRDVGGDHARHGERVQDRRPDRHALPGEIQAVGTPDEIRGCDNPIVQQFIHGRAGSDPGGRVRAMSSGFGVRVWRVRSTPNSRLRTLNWISRRLNASDDDRA